MKIINNSINFKSFTVIGFISILIFIFKWFFSYYFFKDDLSIKIIFDSPSDGFFYYVYLEALSSLNFNNSFDVNIDNLKNIPIPFYAILIPSILHSLFGNYSILVSELICIYLFLFIFFLIFKKLNFGFFYSILASLLLIVIPSIINLFDLNLITYFNNINNIFNLRFPRPLITNIFFYLFIFYLIRLNFNYFFNKQNFIILGILFALSFSSFYYFFFIQLISFIIIIFYKFDLKTLLNKKNLKLYLISIFTFIFLSLPFIFFLLSSEPDYKERLYIIDLNIEKKIILIKYLISKLISLKFLLIFISISILNYMANKKKYFNYEKINIFYILLISSILAPFFFILISNQTGLVYHFTNLITLLLFIYIYIFIINFFVKKFKKKSFKKEFLFYFFIVILVSLYNLNIYKSFLLKNSDEEYVNYRKGIYNSTTFIKNIKSDKINLLTFDPRLMVWGIMNGVKNIRPISGQLVPKKHFMIEDDLIYSFKYLNLSSNSFIKFLENKKSDWRLFNANTQLFFWGRYSASLLKTFNNSENFSKTELEIINKTSPLNVQSIAIPKEELNRLINKFNNYSFKENLSLDIIALDKREAIFKSISIDSHFYCQELSTDIIKIFINKKFNKLCKKKF